MMRCMPPEEVTIRQATPADTAIVSGVLTEVATWLIDRGTPLWRTNELAEGKIAAEVASGQFWVAHVGGEPAGCVRFQLEDELFWPDLPDPGAAYVHRLAVRRKYAGGRVSAALLEWAKGQTRAIGRRVLRLDTDATRPALCAVYDRNGFVRHSLREMGPYLVWRYECEV
jgi:GNAT superfamily N-acetyltransferase